MDLPEATKNITVDWLNQVLSENEFLKGTDIVSIGLEPMGAGKGFTSDMARISLSYAQDSPHLPTTIIAKLPTSFGSIREIAMRTNLYEREIRFYLDVAPGSPIRTPGCIFAEANPEKGGYVLLLEDCSEHTPVDPNLTGLNDKQAGLISLAIADFHARWWDDPELASFTWLPKSQEFPAEWQVDLFRKSWDDCVRIDEFRRALPEGGFEAGTKMHQRFHLLRENSPKDNLSILHADYKADNIFFDKDNPDESIIIFDWGMARTGRSVGDLSILLAFSMTTELRRQVEKEIIGQYHKRLLFKGVSGYSLEECWNDYLKTFLLNATLPIIAFARADQNDVRAKKFFNLIVNRWFSAIVDNGIIDLLPKLPVLGK